MKKFTRILLALTLVFCLTATALAQTVDSGKGGNATITIENASKGETYTVVKLFDASVTGTVGGSIAYTGDIPDALATYFTKDAAGNITAMNAAKVSKTDDEGNTTYSNSLNEAAIKALVEWAKGEGITAAASAECTDGAAMVFTNLQYGYYVVLSSQGAAITVDSTNPNATIYDKNTTEPGATKTADKESYSIGDTITYTATFPTTNWLGAGEEAKQVVKYEISDTPPGFLKDVKVTSIVIDSDGDLDTKEEADRITLDPQQFENKKITIAWVDSEGANLYNNGAQIILTYTAVLTDKATIDDDGTVNEGDNTNTVTLQPYVTDGNDDGPPDRWSETWEAKDTVYTYAAALLKVDENKNSLAGAKFAANGLTVTGEKGNYTVSSYDSTSKTLGTEMYTDDEGKLIIKGLANDVSLTLTETEAPAGYNKLVASITLTPTKIDQVVTVTEAKTYYDENGNETETETNTYTQVNTFNDALKTAAIKVENNKGQLLPSTGGIGTTVFYIGGGVLVLAAAVLLIMRKRMGASK